MNKITQKALFARAAEERDQKKTNVKKKYKKEKGANNKKRY
jgi:hypothetical protein|tara:strand:+ start:1725 stop:1847 length:123 start_codon:yes stop_codon:yes gene_type:complete